MLVFQYNQLEDFLTSLKYRITDEVYSQYVEPNNAMGAASNQHHLILQFLGHPDTKNVNILGLYQIRIEINTRQERDSIIVDLQKAFATAGNIKLIQGSITEIFRSIS